jgi:serine/threonine protein kinase
VYRIIEPLDRGGMASVYKAYEPALDRYIALKVLPPEFLHDPTFAERFRHEAKLIARLEHRHIVPIYNFGIDEGVPWMAMRLVQGGTLSALLKTGALERRLAVEILRESAEALDHAHREGILHRDVKPQNILLDRDGHVYLADFGIAKLVEGLVVLTKTGMISGTPQYMSPEQAQAEKVDHRTDIYALGVVAYEMLFGARAVLGGHSRCDPAEAGVRVDSGSVAVGGAGALVPSGAEGAREEPRRPLAIGFGVRAGARSRVRGERAGSSDRAARRRE